MEAFMPGSHLFTTHSTSKVVTAALAASLVAALCASAKFEYRCIATCGATM
jgi:hypothetical protein